MKIREILEKLISAPMNDLVDTIRSLLPSECEIFKSPLGNLAVRILGESAALLFTAGFAHAVNGIIDGLAAPGATLTVALYVYAKEQGEFGVAFAIAAILMVLTVLINFAAVFVQKYFTRRRSL